MTCAVIEKREARRAPGEGGLAILVGRMASNDQAALADFYDATRRVVYGLVLRIVRDGAAADEVTLDVYSQAWRQAAAYRPERGSPRAWLLTLARSRAIDRIRSRSWRELRREQAIETVAPLPHAGHGPEEETALAERGRLVRRLLGSLPGEQREAIELAYFDGLSQSEIAAHTGHPLGTVKTRIRLGLSRLRELSQQYAEGL